MSISSLITSAGQGYTRLSQLGGGLGGSVLGAIFNRPAHHKGETNYSPVDWNDFISKVKKGGIARNNLYFAGIHIPIILAEKFKGIGVTTKDVGLFCNSTTIPSLNVMTTQARYMGVTRDMPYSRTKEPLTMTFYCDSDMKLKYLFDMWIMSIFNSNVNNKVAYYDSYTTELRIELYNVEEQTTYKANVFEAYPTHVSPVTPAYNQPGVMEFTVTFSYLRWEPVLIAAGGDSKSWLSKLFGDNWNLANQLLVSASDPTQIASILAANITSGGALGGMLGGAVDTVTGWLGLGGHSGNKPDANNAWFYE